MKAYIAGPMRGYPQFNFPLFDKVAGMLRYAGVQVVNPAEHDREVYPDLESWPGWETGSLDACPGFDLTAAMAWDIGQLLECDTIVTPWLGAKQRGAARACDRTHDRQVLWHVYERTPDDWTLEPLPEPKQVFGEVRVTSSTGGEKGRKLARFDLLPAGPLTEVSEHYIWLSSAHMMAHRAPGPVRTASPSCSFWAGGAGYQCSMPPRRTATSPWVRTRCQPSRGRRLAPDRLPWPVAPLSRWRSAGKEKPVPLATSS